MGRLLTNGIVGYGGYHKAIPASCQYIETSGRIHEAQPSHNRDLPVFLLQPRDSYIPRNEALCVERCGPNLILLRVSSNIRVHAWDPSLNRTGDHGTSGVVLI